MEPERSDRPSKGLDIVKIAAVILVVAAVSVTGIYLLSRTEEGDIETPLIETFVCGESEVVDFEGNRYKTAMIGEQCWMSENLMSERDKDGNWIPRECYDDDPEMCDLYGGLYDWRTASIACPDGWELPTDDDFKEMERYLGMEEEEIDFLGWRYSGDVARKMMAGGESGFDALMAGHVDSSYVFHGFGYYAFFWTSTPSGDFATRRYISTTELGVVRNNKEQEYGFSVRCILR